MPHSCLWSGESSSASSVSFFLPSARVVPEAVEDLDLPLSKIRVIPLPLGRGEGRATSAKRLRYWIKNKEKRLRHARPGEGTGRETSDYDSRVRLGRAL